MTLDLDLYLQSYLTVTLPILWIILICGTNTTYVSRTISRSKVKVTWVVCSRTVGILVDHRPTTNSLHYIAEIKSKFVIHNTLKSEKM